MKPPVGKLVPSLLGFAALLVGCERGSAPGSPAGGQRPNIILIVWDTVRADRLSLYGWQRPTTPFLEQWARGARVFEDCVSAGSTTVPAHGAMFTGLLPSEHQANNEDPRLAEQFDTLAELLKRAGYSTYLYSENPHICAANNFTQGFDVVEHPWSVQYLREALRITAEKAPPYDQTSGLPEKLRTGRLGSWSVKACGELAQRGVANWLAQQDRSRPFFIFLNYMEAHRPLIPRREYRARLMSPAQVEASYRVDRKWVTMWSYVFGLFDYSAADLELTGLTYDAALLELDDLFRRLLEFLQSGGHLDNTAVVLVSDHGEHLGEHHLLDHQFSVYEPVMRVPLVVYYPPRVAPGRDSRPVSNIDVYPTLLELAGIEPPLRSKAVSLLHPLESRRRFGEYPAVMAGTFRRVRERYPTFDPTPWRRTLRAFYDGRYKLIAASDGSHELYDLDADPAEQRNLFDVRPELAQRMLTRLRDYVRSLLPISVSRPGRRPLEPGERELLEILGYIEPEPAGQPGSAPAP